MKYSIKDFSEMFSEYRNRYIGFALSYTQNRDVAEDLVMDAILSFWQMHESLPEGSNIHAYIFVAIKNKCLDYLRSLRNTAEERGDGMPWDIKDRIEALEAFYPNDLNIKEITGIVRTVLNSMPEKTRKVFLLSRYYNISQKEISQKYGISVKGVEYHISKVLSRLRIALSDY